MRASTHAWAARSACTASLPRPGYTTARRIMMKAARTQYDKVSMLEDHPDWPEAARLFRTYVDRRMHQEKFAPPLRET